MRILFYISIDSELSDTITLELITSGKPNYEGFNYLNAFSFSLALKSTEQKDEIKPTLNRQSWNFTLPLSQVSLLQY